MTPPIHLTLLALAELAPAARWWGKSFEAQNHVLSKAACDWTHLDGRPACALSSIQFLKERRRWPDSWPTCPACLVMLDWALEQEQES